MTSSLPEKGTIKETINNYCSLKGISKNELAVQLGVSSAVLSQIERGNWENIHERMWRKVWNKVNVESSVEVTIETRDFRAVITACENARKNRFMIGIIGDTGTGKTTALTTAALRKNTFYVSYEKSMKPKQFFAALLKEMGVAFEGSIHEMVTKITDELNTLSNPLVIIDEAGKITHTVVLYMHVIRDKTKKNCGIVLGGMPYFKNNLIKFANKQKEGVAEFLRRIMVWHELTGLSRIEVKTICQAYGITDEEIIRSMYNKKLFGDLYNAILLHQLELEN